MQGGVFGGICLLACLVSWVQGEESDILKQEESKVELMKGKELSSEDEDSKKLKVTSNDLNITREYTNRIVLITFHETRYLYFIIRKEQIKYLCCLA